MAEFDGIVSDLAAPLPSARIAQGLATNGRGESPGVSRPDYHTDIPIDARPAFAKSVMDDGGLSTLVSPSERSPTTREAQLASDQSGVQGSIAVKPREFMMQTQDKASRGTAKRVNPEEVGLAMTPHP